MRINLDETGCKFWNGKQLGNVYIGKGLKSKAISKYKAKVGTHEAKLALTHVALLADDPEIQMRIPQVLLVNQYSVRVEDYDYLQSTMPPNIYIIRSNSSWLSEPILERILHLLFLSLVAFDSLHVLFYMDTYGPHCAFRIAATCHEFGWDLIYIPALCTWLLQPLDVVVFRIYKARLRKKIHELRLSSPNGKHSKLQWIQAVIDTITELLDNNDWSSAFEKVGLGSNQANVSQYVRDQFGDLGMPAIADAPPSDQVVSNLFPNRRPFTPGMVFPNLAPIPYVPPAEVPLGIEMPSDPGVEPVAIAAVPN